jgi:hypothetical protein
MPGSGKQKLSAKVCENKTVLLYQEAVSSNAYAIIAHKSNSVLINFLPGNLIRQVYKKGDK